jgi:hypothetical protein
VIAYKNKYTKGKRMIKIKLTGIIEEVHYKGIKSCTFRVRDKYNNKLLCTIIHRDMQLACKVEKDNECCITGDIRLYSKKKNDNMHYSNTFYVSHIELLEKENSNQNNTQNLEGLAEVII